MGAVRQHGLLVAGDLLSSAYLGIIGALCPQCLDDGPFSIIPMPSTG
jgi:hypothetical protein